ncbi:TetR family transcriptional regulator [Aquincola tertiaricarbonis]|uniref:TetR family transcriptional regulator n=1 Tax=Aquincola tertiaricarbonis TaxID=391953 RepID=A0ABY4SE77_AQUTE|nr:TetR family transcriptional regulator [Aquincola tertiaricarbonis]URI11632.1 TetR family transcriptional regulator [Aquincola tertiaricarbonis]
MARPRTVDREYILDVAEGVAAATGAAGLSFGAVAAAAGMSKASVQSAFGTRESLIEAMLDRWLAQETARFTAKAGESPSLKVRVLAHIANTSEESEVSMQRAATLLACLAGSDSQVGAVARWYTTRVGDLSVRNDEERRLRLAFLAAEGAFFMRYVVGYSMCTERWSDIFEDLTRMAGEPERKQDRQGRRKQL